MKHDAEIVSKRANMDIYYYPPAGSAPEIILDIGCDEKGSSLRAYSRSFPDAKIFSIEFSLPKILRLRETLAYHDNIKYMYAEGHDIDLVLEKYGLRNTVIDFVKIFTPNKEKYIFSDYPVWPKMTRFVVARISGNYDYNLAKTDLRKLGFNASAFYNNMCYFVMGENRNV